MNDIRHDERCTARQLLIRRLVADLSPIKLEVNSETMSLLEFFAALNQRLYQFRDNRILSHPTANVIAELSLVLLIYSEYRTRA